MRFRASGLQSALARESARRRIVQCVLDVPLCAGCALLMYEMNIRSTEDVTSFEEGWRYWRLVVLVLVLEVEGDEEEDGRAGLH